MSRLPGRGKWEDPPDDDEREWEDEDGNLHPIARCHKHRMNYLEDEECPKCTQEIEDYEFDPGEAKEWFDFDPEC